MELAALRIRRRKIHFNWMSLSLRSRLAIAISFLMISVVSFFFLLIFRQNEITTFLFFKIILAVLCFLILTLLVFCFRMIALIPKSILKLAADLDQIDIEGELPQGLPKFSSQVPELEAVAISFGRLLDRLRGYRAVNLKRLLVEKRRADMIAALISDGVLLLRKDEILYFNPIAEKILEIPSLQDKTNSWEQTSGGKAVRKAISQTLPVEYSFTEDERQFNYLIRAFPISFDIIEHLRFKVGSAVEQVLDEFQADMLVLAQDVTLVKESQEAKSHFLATLSHEIRTPVTSLTMATRLLKKAIDQIPNPNHQSLVMTCVEDVDRLRILLEDLLNVSRFDTLAQRLEVQKIDLGKLVRHSAQSFHFQASERGIELSQKIVSHGKPMMVSMDATKIAWALSNLIINALRHTPRGGKVEVCVEMNESSAQVSVSDTGPGIERHRQGKIFEKFSSYYDLRIARSGSVGAGLAIAKEIVVAHGGRIWVESEPGHGANFCFTLPTRQKMTSFNLESGMEQSEEFRFSSDQTDSTFKRGSSRNEHEKNRYSL